MFTMNRGLSVATLLACFLSFDGVFADCDDSIICCDRVNEILIIAAIFAICVFFLILCLVIVCLVWRISKIEKRLNEYETRRGSLNYYNNFQMAPIDGGSEEKESDTATGSGPGSLQRVRGDSFPDSKGKPRIVEAKIYQPGDGEWTFY